MEICSNPDHPYRSHIEFDKKRHPRGMVDAAPNNGLELEPHPLKVKCTSNTFRDLFYVSKRKSLPKNIISPTDNKESAGLAEAITRRLNTPSNQSCPVIGQPPPAKYSVAPAQKVSLIFEIYLIIV